MDLKYRGDQARLFKLCADLKWKQSHIALYVGISRQEMNQFWQGKRELPEHLFDKILEQITSDCLDKGIDMMGLEDRVARLEAKLG